MIGLADCWGEGLQAIISGLPSAEAVCAVYQSFDTVEINVKPAFFRQYVRGLETIEQSMERAACSYLGGVEVPGGCWAMIEQARRMGLEIDLCFDPHADGCLSGVAGYHQNTIGHGSPFYFPFESVEDEEAHYQLAQDVCRYVKPRRWTLSNEPQYMRDSPYGGGGSIRREDYGRYVVRMAAALRSVHPDVLLIGAGNGWEVDWYGQPGAEGVALGLHHVFPQSGTAAGNLAEFQAMTQAAVNRWGSGVEIAWDEVSPVGTKLSTASPEGAEATRAVLDWLLGQGYYVSLLVVGGASPVYNAHWQTSMALVGLDGDRVTVTPSVEAVAAVAARYGIGSPGESTEPEDMMSEDEVREVLAYVQKALAGAWRLDELVNAQPAQRVLRKRVRRNLRKAELDLLEALADQLEN